MTTPPPGGRPPFADTNRAHPVRLYLRAWGLLFVLSALSYLVDIAGLEGLARWVPILLFMVLKAGLIVAVFMHVAWERLALACAILLPPLAVVAFAAIMAAESAHTAAARGALGGG